MLTDGVEGAAGAAGCTERVGAGVVSGCVAAGVAVVVVGVESDAATGGVGAVGAGDGVGACVLEAVEVGTFVGVVDCAGVDVVSVTSALGTEAAAGVVAAVCT